MPTLPDINGEQSRIEKVMLTLTDLVTSGLLNPEQSNQFIRKILDEPTIINECRTITMSSPTREINKIGFGSRILRPAVQTEGSRALAAANYGKPTTEKITISTVEVIAEVHLPYETLEDNIEKGNLEDTVLALIAQRAALDLEELVLLGDTASADDYLAQFDGVLKLCSAHVHDANAAKVSPTVFNTAKKTLPTKYRRNLGTMKFYVHPDLESDYRLLVSSRATQLGDAILTGTQPLPVFGIPMKGAALMPYAQMLLTNPLNIIVGFHRGIRMEFDRNIQTREIIIVLTMRVGTQIEETDAMVKTINLIQ